jgi:hypothetical protein
MHGSQLRPLALLALLALLASLAACGEDRYGGQFDVSAPVATESSLVWIDRTHREAVFVRPAGDDLEVARQPLGDDRITPAWLVALRSGGGALVLTSPASVKEEDVGDRVHRFSEGGDDAVEYEVAAPFTSVAQTPDHRRAVLYFGAGESSEVLANANQVAILDLAGDGTRDFTLNGFGDTVARVEFPAQRAEGEPAGVVVDGVPRDLAAFVAGSELVLVDMDDPELDQVAIPFPVTFSGSTALTYLRPGNDLYQNPVLFVRGAAEVAKLDLVGEPGGGGFTAQVGLLPGGAATDMVHFDGATAPYLITADPASSDLDFTDIRTLGGFSIDLAAPAERLFLRDHQGSGGPVRQVVAWSQGGTSIATLELGDIDNALGREPRYLSVPAGIGGLVQLDNDRLLIGAGLKLYVIDLATEQVTPLVSQVGYDPQFSAIVDDRLLLGTPSQSYVSTVDLATTNPESMVLDHPIVDFFYLAGPKRIVVTHPDIVGHLTVVDAAEASRATSRSFWGFLFDGEIDRH